MTADTPANVTADTHAKEVARRCKTWPRYHVSKNCKKKRECKKCKKPHPTLPQIDDFSLAKERSAEEKSTKKPIKVNNSCTDIPQNDNKQEIILQAIIPVLVTNTANNKALKTYAFYDNGSVGCFLAENLRHRLHPGTETTLQNQWHLWAISKPCSIKYLCQPVSHRSCAEQIMPTQYLAQKTNPMSILLLKCL